MQYAKKYNRYVYNTCLISLLAVASNVISKLNRSDLQEITGAQLTSIQQDDSVALIHLYNEDSKSSLVRCFTAI